MLQRERFNVTPQIVAGSNTQYSEATVATKAVEDSRVSVPAMPPAGLTYRFKLGGAKTGTDAAHTATLVLNGTVVMTLTADDASAGDWIAEFTIRFTNAKIQKIMGEMHKNTADYDVDYAAGAVDCSNGALLEAKIANGHTSDVTTCEMLTVEKWIF